MTEEIIPHFHNDLGVQVIEIGAKKFMCMGALPPQDHPHVFCDMGHLAVGKCQHQDAMGPRHSLQTNPIGRRPKGQCSVNFGQEKK
jgi:uncharacterized Zn-finger protein